MSPQMIVWRVVLPAVICAVVLFLGWQPWRKDADGQVRGLKRYWVPGVAVGISYIVLHWIALGGPGQTNDISVWVVFLTIGAISLGVLEESLDLPVVVRWLLRPVSGIIFAWLLLRPLFGTTLIGSNFTLAVSAVAIAFFAVWSAIAWAAAREEGPFFALRLLILIGGTSVTLVLSALATSGQVLVTLLGVVGVVLLFSWRFRARGQLRGLAPVMATILVGHWTIAVAYAEMPQTSYILLCVGAIALIKLPIMLAKGFRRTLTVIAALIALSIPLAAAAGIAAANYFSETTTENAIEDDYGYD